MGTTFDFLNDLDPESQQLRYYRPKKFQTQISGLQCIRTTQVHLELQWLYQLQNYLPNIFNTKILGLCWMLTTQAQLELHWSSCMIWILVFHVLDFTCVFHQIQNFLLQSLNFLVNPFIFGWAYIKTSKYQLGLVFVLLYLKYNFS